MIILEDKFNTKFQYNTYVALGSFDGLHLGHMELIKKTLELAKEHNGKSMIYTFKNHPLTVVNKQLAPKLLMDNDLKLHILNSLGIDIVNLAPFDEELMKISPEAFITNMIKFYNIKGFIVGFNYRFGYKNQGDVEFLKSLSCKLGFEVFVIEPVKYDNLPVSSSRIRELISIGDVYTSNKMLAKPYMIEGKVIKGKQLGRTIGFPTANLEINYDFVLPNKGVYFTTVDYNGTQFKGITNVGYNPTVNGEKLSIETFILDFNKSIYGEVIKVYFINKIRDEIKFGSLKELSDQLAKDENYAKSQKLQIIL